MNNQLFVSGSPHVHSNESVKKIMWAVVIALLPALLVSIYYFGLPAILITVVSICSCLLFEYLIQKFLLKEKSSLCNGSAVITGLLLAFNLPSNLPLPWVVVGAFVAIAIGKMAFGGLGKNPFNPALVGRVFLLISRPVEMTTWPLPTPVWAFGTDAVTGPTPLGILKEGGINGESIGQLMEKMPNYVQMLFGQMGGSFGEISVIALIVGALFLIFRKVITWHIPVSFILSSFLLAGILYLHKPECYANPFFHIVTGGLILGACFMATDMVTSPSSPWGMIVFGCGCGILTIVIRTFGAYPEGVSFAILLMNAVTPLINKAFKPKKFGGNSK
ncbi:MAG: RnfABCDGE type electron transport complex subunit D [Lentimicrobiaceae bacterium]|nr:RnfABCDGE type electron transport complex subunit D [Lentimicrobiaceae bacterium]